MKFLARRGENLTVDESDKGRTGVKFAAMFIAGLLLSGCGTSLSHSSESPLPTLPAFTGAIGGASNKIVDGLPVAQKQNSDLPEKPTGVINISASALFALGQYNLLPTAKAALEESANEIRSIDPNATIEFVGHTDCQGDASSNNQLSLQRAEAVMNWFKANGFAGSKLSAIGVGSTQPIAQDCLPGGAVNQIAAQKNRRVDIILKS